MQPAAMLAVADPYRFQDVSLFNSTFIHCDGITRHGGVWIIDWPPIRVVFNIPTPVRMLGKEIPMTTIWTCPDGHYQLRTSETGKWAWFVKCVDDTWQQLYGTYPPTSVVEEFAKQSYASLMRARRGLVA